MSQLDLCSRREADNYIAQGKVLIRGKMVEPILGQKINSDETDISIVHGDENENVQTERFGKW